jgi:hypothetical protein
MSGWQVYELHLIVSLHGERLFSRSERFAVRGQPVNDYGAPRRVLLVQCQASIHLDSLILVPPENFLCHRWISGEEADRLVDLVREEDYLPGPDFGPIQPPL